MNYRIVATQLGVLSVLLSVILLTMAAIALTIEWWRLERVDNAAVAALLITGGAGLLAGGTLWFFGRRGSRFLGRREALLLVASSWIGGALLGALPFWIWAQLRFAPGDDHPFRSLVSCYFESMSGLTTTGATVLAEVEALPPSLLVWRALTHWLGGLGIVVLFVAVLPGLGVGGKRLFQIESPGPSPEGLQPHVRETARWLWFIYLGLTVLEIAALWIFTPMDGFEAVCHTFATLATGGFSTMNASIGAYHSTPAVDVIVIIFMVLAGVNFGLYYRLCRGKLGSVLQDVELRVYLVVLGAGAVLVCSALLISAQPILLTSGVSVPAGVGEVLRQGLFTTVSIQTTTGFCTSDFNLWPVLARAVLILLMFVGGCSGSTAGGIKIIRVWVAFKVLWMQVEQVFRPHVVRPVQVGRATVELELRLAVLAYVLIIALFFAGGTIAILLLEQLGGQPCDLTTAASACAATLCNVGPGLAQVGAVENYGWFTAPAKLLMCLLMALGRLEVFAIIVLFSRRFWRNN